MRYYEVFTMTANEREALSMTFDNNMSLLGKTFWNRVEWIFDSDIRELCEKLYKRSQNIYQHIKQMKQKHPY